MFKSPTSCDGVLNWGCLAGILIGIYFGYGWAGNLELIITNRKGRLETFPRDLLRCIPYSFLSFYIYLLVDNSLGIM